MLQRGLQQRNDGLRQIPRPLNQRTVAAGDPQTAHLQRVEDRTELLGQIGNVAKGDTDSISQLVGYAQLM
ncbi:hypothetical protein D3C81_1387700 [compost metagenome]